MKGDIKDMLSRVAYAKRFCEKLCTQRDSEELREEILQKIVYAKGFRREVVHDARSWIASG